MEIRRARDEELPAVGELLVEVYVGGGFIAATDGYVSELADVRARAAGADVLVAVDEDKLVGSVTWCADGSAYREIGRPDEGEFRTLVVSPAARGRGIGEALVRHCLELSYAAGHRGMVLSTLPSMVDAHRLYERLGFTRDPERDWNPHPAERLWAFAKRY
jgi:ribosomal protein S18 acetylase RimI-like enzyme